MARLITLILNGSGPLHGINIQMHACCIINLQLYIWSHCLVNLSSIPGETSSFTKRSLEKNGFLLFRSGQFNC